MRFRRRRGLRLAAAALLIAVQVVHPATAWAWGLEGHLMAGRVASLRCPPEMPEFFRRATDQLSYLCPEPDRWRDRDERAADPAMDSATSPEHFIDLELVSPAALGAKDRLIYAAELTKGGVDPGKAGILPFTILEHFQKLRVEFKLWRAEPDGPRRRFIEQRIINDAGIMGHYVTDGSNPHHTTIHYNGWASPNDKGYTVDRSFHGRFEGGFVKSKVTLDDLMANVSPDARLLDNPRKAVWEFLQATNAQVVPLYELEKSSAYGPDQPGAAHKAFAVDRLAAGTSMLRDLWWTAWVTSGVRTTPADAR